MGGLQFDWTRQVDTRIHAGRTGFGPFQSIQQHPTTQGLQDPACASKIEIMFPIRCG